MLCEYCKKFSIRSLRCDRFLDHQPSLYSLKQSAEQGCELCVHLYDCLGVDITREISDVDDGGIFIIGSYFYRDEAYRKVTRKLRVPPAQEFMEVQADGFIGGLHLSTFGG